MYTVYDHPSDYPDHFVIRKFMIHPGGKQTVDKELFFKSSDIEECRRQMRSMGLHCLSRDPTDDPVIVETWL
jgi:hypothetical protein